MSTDISAVAKAVIKKLRLNAEEKAQFLELRVYYLSAAAASAANSYATQHVSFDPDLSLADPMTNSDVRETENAYQEKLKAASPRIVAAMKMFIEEFG